MDASNGRSQCTTAEGIDRPKRGPARGLPRGRSEAPARPRLGGSHRREVVLDVRVSPRARGCDGGRDDLRERLESLQLAALFHQEPVDPVLYPVPLGERADPPPPCGGDDVAVAPPQELLPLHRARLGWEVLRVEHAVEPPVPELVPEEREVEIRVQVREAAAQLDEPPREPLREARVVLEDESATVAARDLPPDREVAQGARDDSAPVAEVVPSKEAPELRRHDERAAVHRGRPRAPREERLSRRLPRPLAKRLPPVGPPVEVHDADVEALREAVAVDRAGERREELRLVEEAALLAADRGEAALALACPNRRLDDPAAFLDVLEREADECFRVHDLLEVRAAPVEAKALAENGVEEFLGDVVSLGVVLGRERVAVREDAAPLVERRQE